MSLIQLPSISALTGEAAFSVSRSSGPGGQNVNKVNSKVTLKLDIIHSSALSQEQKELLLTKNRSRITREGVLMITVQEHRSQLQNKEAALAKLSEVIIKSFTRRKARKATKPSASAVRARIQDKKRRSEKKQWRNKGIGS